MTSPEPQTDFGDKLPQTSYEPPRKQRRWLRLLLALNINRRGWNGVVWRLLTPANQQPASTNAQPPGVRVKVAPVQIGTIDDSTEYIASLESRRSVTLQPRIQGQVTPNICQVRRYNRNGSSSYPSRPQTATSSSH